MVLNYHIIMKTILYKVIKQNFKYFDFSLNIIKQQDLKQILKFLILLKYFKDIQMHFIKLIYMKF